MLRPPPAGSQLSVHARVHHRRGLLLVGLGGFQLWLWGTRTVNLLGAADSFSTAFVAVHLVLYLAAIGAGVLLLGLGWRLLREAVRAGAAVSAGAAANGAAAAAGAGADGAAGRGAGTADGGRRMPAGQDLGS